MVFKKSRPIGYYCIEWAVSSSSIRSSFEIRKRTPSLKGLSVLDFCFRWDDEVAGILLPISKREDSYARECPAGDTSKHPSID
jgi:hypothetical protein